MMREYPDLPDSVRKPRGIPENSPTASIGVRLRAIRERYVAQGGRLLSKEELSKEIAERRGGAAGSTRDKEDLR
jgi:hypothetical protein